MAKPNPKGPSRISNILSRLLVAMARPNWTAIGVVGSLSMSALALWFSYEQMPERSATLRLEVERVQFVNRSPGQWLAAPTVVIKNDGRSRAERVVMEFQHWPLSWTGVVPARESFDIDPGEAKMLFMSADTVADPDGILSSGKHLYFAVRAKWTNSATGKPGCRIYYLDVRIAPGPEVGSRLPLLDVLGERPTALLPPDIGVCPGP